jgi:UDP-N-acetylmuramyl pentapeptide synthase
MLELGPEEIDFHRQIGEHARSSGVDLLVTVGQLAEHMGGDHAVGAAAEAAELLSGLLQRGDTVLIKGSRGVGLEAILQELSTNG